MFSSKRSSGYGECNFVKLAQTFCQNSERFGSKSKNDERISAYFGN